MFNIQEGFATPHLGDNSLLSQLFYKTIFIAFMQPLLWIPRILCHNNHDTNMLFGRLYKVLKAEFYINS